MSNVGYISDSGRYNRLTQSDASETVLVRYVVEGEERYPSGTETVDGTEWVVYERQGDEPVWVTDLDDVRLLITGSDDERRAPDSLAVFLRDVRERVLDALACSGQVLLAPSGQKFAALPKSEGGVEIQPALFEHLDHVDQFVACGLVTHLGHRCIGH